MRPTVVERTVPAAAGAVLSVFIFYRLRIPESFVFPIFLISLLSLLLLIFQAFRKLSGAGRSTQAYILTILFFSGFSASLTSQSAGLLLAGSRYTGIPADRVQSADVVLTSDPQRLSGGRWVSSGRLLQTHSHEVSCISRGRITIFGKGDCSIPGAGMKLRLNGSLLKDQRGKGGGLSAGYTFFCDEYRCTGWTHRIFERRRKLTEQMEKKLFSGSWNSGVLLSALLLGRRSDSESLLIRNFRESGCMHILALSGLHVGLIAFALRALLKPVTGFIAASLISAAGVVVFLFLVGSRPSLLRAVVMYLLYTRDTLRGYKVRPLKYLSAVFLLQSFLFPLSVCSLSFRLSYAALCGLLISGIAYSRLLHRYLPMKLSAALGAGLGAQLTTLPLITASFGVWYPAGIAAAPLLTVLSSVLMALGSLRLIFPLSGRAGIFLSGLIDKLVNLISRAAGFFSLIPGLEITWFLSWLIAVSGTILPLILIRSIHRGHQSFNQPRFPILHKGLSGEPGTGPAKALGTELPDKSRSPGENNFLSGDGKFSYSLGDRSRAGGHEYPYS